MRSGEATARVLDDDQEVSTASEGLRASLHLVPILNHLGLTAAESHVDHTGAVDAIHGAEQ